MVSLLTPDLERVDIMRVVASVTHHIRVPRAKSLPTRQRQRAATTGLYISVSAQEKLCSFSNFANEVGIVVVKKRLYDRVRVMRHQPRELDYVVTWLSPNVMCNIH